MVRKVIARDRVTFWSNKSINESGELVCNIKAPYSFCQSGKFQGFSGDALNESPEENESMSSCMSSTKEKPLPSFLLWSWSPPVWLLLLLSWFMAGSLELEELMVRCQRTQNPCWSCSAKN